MNNPVVTVPLTPSKLVPSQFPQASRATNHFSIWILLFLITLFVSLILFKFLKDHKFSNSNE